MNNLTPLWRALGVKGPRDLDGYTFLRTVAFFDELGADLADLDRSVMTRKQLALLAVARRELAITDEDYARMLTDIGGGVRSATDLDQRGFDRLMAYLEVRGFEPMRAAPKLKPAESFDQRCGMASAGQLDLVWALWREWSGGDDEAALAARLERTCKVSSLRFLTAQAAGKAIAGLRTMKARARKQAQTDDVVA